MPQFLPAATAYGSPIGRHEWLADSAPAARSVQLFRVRLDADGYDDGGAYWGAGKPLFCAQDDAGLFRRFVRAESRAAAAEALRLPSWMLKRPA